MSESGIKPLLLCFLAIGLLSSGVAWAQEKLPDQLLVFDAEYCEWCEMFYEETAPGYQLSAEGKQFPIVAQNIHDPLPTQYQDILPATITPTFVWIRAGREAGRMVGYPGREIFWWQIAAWIDGDA